MPALVSAGILVIALILFGTANLDRETSAIPLEMFLSLVGIVLFTPIFRPEEKKEIDDLVSSKYVGRSRIYLIRGVCAMLLATGFVGVFTLAMRARMCDVTWLLFAGTVADAVFLGAVGMAAAALADNTVAGYMAAFVTYGINWGAGRNLGNFYLFSMSISEYEPKVWLFVTGMLLISASFTVKWIKRRLR